MDFEWSWEATWEVLPLLLEAFLRITLLVTVVGSLLAATLGLFLAIAVRELPRPLSRVLAWFADVVRMTPLPIQLFFAAYLFADLGGYRRFSEYSNATIATVIGIVVIGIHYSTYMAESYRAGIESVRPGQWEAATALSLPRSRTWRAVIVPQALRATLPSLGNWAIAMFKDTPFLIVISVPEMVTVAREYGGKTFTYVEAFTVAGVIFLLASYPTAVLMRRLEKKLVY